MGPLIKRGTIASSTGAAPLLLAALLTSSCSIDSRVVEVNAGGDEMGGPPSAGGMGGTEASGVAGEDGEDAAGASGDSSGLEPPVGQSPREGMLLAEPPPPDCGNGITGDDEACDDSNQQSGDGCSANCLVVEQGHECLAPGDLCPIAEVCGDGVIRGKETCDDGIAAGGDGCSSSCRVEAGYSCEAAGTACSPPTCSNQIIERGERCDDGNQSALDGCSASCQLEAGWQCPLAGAPCVPLCSDGLLLGGEGCDDGNDVPGDGCNANCRTEPGFVCRAPGDACDLTTCQDGVVEGSEACDDANDRPYDGCNARCVPEPQCANNFGTYACSTTCGDGNRAGTEACDDGNVTPNDGCNARCELEPGYSCAHEVVEVGSVLELPVVVRDFSIMHPQFEIDPIMARRLPGMVLPQLGLNGKPRYNPSFSFQNRPWTLDGPGAAAGAQAASAAPTLNAAQIAALFEGWYSDVPGQNQTLVGVLPAELQAGGSFQFSRSGANPFFPIDGRGFGNEGNSSNFYFTTEVHHWFVRQGGELVRFRGDDDVWIFINGRLALDLGGIHGEIEGSIELGAPGNASELCVQDEAGLPVVCSSFQVPSTGDIDEIAIFHAERHVTISDYTLELRAHGTFLSTCTPVCGDGVFTPDETCDDGALNGSGYNHCALDCTLGPRCGDRRIDAGEDCDNGDNSDPYSTDPAACAPGCRIPGFCGDGVVDAVFDEQCDDSVNDGSYGGCSATCGLGPRCGDREINGDETCDDGNRLNTDGCDINCREERDLL